MNKETCGIANALLREVKEVTGDFATPLKLQKLLYLLYGSYAIRHNKRLFEEPFVAWYFGPVLFSVYQGFKAYRNRPINHYGRVGKKSYLAKNENILREIAMVVSEYGTRDAATLVNLTHLPGGAWAKAYKGGLGRGRPLGLRDIFEEFRSRV